MRSSSRSVRRLGAIGVTLATLSSGAALAAPASIRFGAHGRHVERYHRHHRGHGVHRHRRFYGPRLYYGYRPGYRRYAYSRFRPGFVVTTYRPGAGTSRHQGYAYGKGAVRTKVTPKQTEIYVDGYYVGIADDFDGTFQRLYLSPGEHDLELRLDGYRTYRAPLLVRPNHTQVFGHRMQPPAPSEASSARDAPGASVLPGDGAGCASGASKTSRPEPANAPPPPGHPPDRDETPRRSVFGATGVRFGVLALRVQPPEAEVFIDGKPWGDLQGIEELPVHLPAGRHVIEIRPPGSSPFRTEVTIREGETTPLNVQLPL